MLKPGEGHGALRGSISYFYKRLKFYIIKNTKIPTERAGFGLRCSSVPSPGRLHIVGLTVTEGHTLEAKSERSFRKQSTCEHLGSPHSLVQPKGGKNPDQLPVSGVLLYFKGKGMGLTSDGDVGKARVLFS